MGRRPRMEEEGGIYHVIQRGNNKEFVFGDDRDKEYLAGQFNLLVSGGCQIYGFVIMGNHYHLILRIWGEQLKSIMHRLNLRYSKYYNKKHSRTGHVFQGRYKSVPVRDERYLLSLLRYVHQNPVRAGVCRKVGEYCWSSDSHYRENKIEWVETGLLLEMLSGDRKTAIKKYGQFMAEEETGDYKNTPSMDETPKGQATKAKSKEIVHNKSLDEILLATGVSEQEFQLIKSGSRKRTLSGYKLAYAREALKLNYSMKAIGENIKVSDVAILYKLTKDNLIT